MELEQLKRLDYIFEDSTTSYCDDDDCRVVRFQLTDGTEPFDWFENSGLKLTINSPYDCTGLWFSAYQEYDEENNILYDIQYIDC